ncbi:MAG TPA: chromosome partitioning protein, partial [Gammaproteobacteria bacterium]|nr:chromosome partitioning protein [Gammaproteobacteria bacterium]
TINSYHWLVESARFDEVRRDSSAEYSIIPSNTDLTAAEMDLLRSERRNFRLKEKLEAINSFEYIIIDCPPSLNVLTLNALFTSGSVLIPVQCEYYALEGLSALLETVDGVRNNGNSDLGLEGILRTMFDTRISLTREVSRQLIQHFKDKVYRTVIPRNVRLAEAPSHGIPAMLYDRTSRGAVAYQALAAEMLRNHMETPEEEMVCE